MKKSIFISALLVCLFAFCASNAQAELIIINITATVNYLEDFGNYLEGKIHVGDTITGSYTYESTTPDTAPFNDPTVGDYWHHSQPCGIFLTVGGFQFKTDPTNVSFLVEVINDKSDIGDAYTLISYNNLSLSNGVAVDGISWQITDNAATALSSDVLPVTAPILSQWQDNDLMIDGEHGGYGFHAHVTSVELVPEPGTFLLLTLGALAIRKRGHFHI